jgi:Group II intron, maturase-specific domain
MGDMTSTKPYFIAKRTVWEAYQQVEANRGAAGIDDETLAMFEQDLSKNLYKPWDRMSSGQYFPPPVKQVEIPKTTGGTRKLGIADALKRMRQNVRGWKLNRQTPVAVAELAGQYNPMIQGWWNYYGAFYQTAMLHIYQHIDRAPERWARRK